METCRTCAKCDFESDDSNWFDLFHPNCNINLKNEIAQIRLEFSYWKLKIFPNDGLPQKICCDCFNKFCTVYTFRLRCQEAQNKLSNIFDKIETGTLEDESQEEEINFESNIEETVSINEITTTNAAATTITSTTTNTAHIYYELIEEETASATQPEPEVETEAELVEIEITNGNTDLHNDDDNFLTIKSTEIIENNNFIKFSCQYCYKSKQIYQNQNELLEHILSEHDEKQPYKCAADTCEASFQDAASRTVHMSRDHVEKNFACEVCGKQYSDRFNLKNHIEKFHSETDFECNMCDKRFFTRKSLNYHSKWHNPKDVLKCTYCDRLFINRRHREAHEATHTGIRNREICSFCGKSFMHLKTLRYHIFRQHGGEKPYKCSHCTEAFASYGEKRLHMLCKHAENLTAIERSECMFCRERFANEIDLAAHMKQLHAQAQGGTKSNGGGMIIKNNKRVLQQKRTKKFSGIFRCNVCDARFNMKTALERHEAVHSIEGRPHKCAECSKRFKRSQDLNWHMKTHSSEHNQCDICGKSFALKYVLTQHKRSHEVLEKKFKCTVCNRAYLFEKSLRLHERTHTGKSYYKCDLCSEHFVTHIKFKTHMKKMHSDEDFIKLTLPMDEISYSILMPENISN